MKKITNLKFNVIDFIIIIVIFAIILSVVYRQKLIDKFIVDESAVVYTVKIQNTQEDYFDFWNVGDNVYIEDNVLAGKIINKDKQPSTVYNVTSDGQIKKTVLPDGQTDVYLEIETLAIVDEEGIRIGGKHFICAGKTMACKTDKIQFDVEIRDVITK